MWQRRIYIRCARIDENQGWERARQVVEAISRIMLGTGGDELTPENPVTETTSMSGHGPVKTETKVKRVLNVEYEQRVKELEAQKQKIDVEGAKALEQLKKQWAGQANG